MGPRTRTQRFSERTIQQVRLDGHRALVRAHFCPERSEVVHLRCVDDSPETESGFGSQLWYFEGVGVDAEDRRQGVYGIVEYSIQFGLHELGEDGVFDSETQRSRFRQLYNREVRRPSWRQLPHRWLAIGLLAVAAVTLVVQLVRSLSA